MRLEALQNDIRQRGLDALAVTNPAHIRILCGAHVGRAVLFVSPDDAVLIAHFVDLEDARKHAQGVDVVEFTAMGGETNSQLAVLPNAERFHKVGFEAAYLPVAQLESFRKQMPNAEFVPVSGMVERLAGVKDAGELDTLRRACRIADDAMALAVEQLHEGVTERDVALTIDTFMRKAGATSISFLLLQFGARASLPHGEPLDTPLRHGDYVLIDIGPAIDGYYADLTRTFVFGKADERHREVYDTVLRAQFATLDAVRPGATGNDVDAVSRKIIGDADTVSTTGIAWGTASVPDRVLRQGMRRRWSRAMWSPWSRGSTFRIGAACALKIPWW